MTRVLVVEDNTTIADGIALNLQLEGCDVRVASTVQQARALVASFAPELLLLDIMLPDGDGLSLLETLRSDGFNGPVLVLSARGAEAEKLRGFRAGADDYVTKPFGLRELLARVSALTRRASRTLESEDREHVMIGDAVISLRARTVTRAGDPVILRPREWDLLLALLRHRSAVVSRSSLLREVWGYGAGVHSRTVDTHMVELRRKLGDDPVQPRYILTVRKLGYRLVPDGPLASPSRR
ncbi:MAG: response regulator transcription factor [Cytophagaceae bacterium]|nr:response regulator transcription factor [Gemmatimonadaceae bacterium]